ncbi:O-methyltransferase [Ramaria rubella]|nr:O-methyltransferase [Ramaria rubella]
MSTFRVLRRLHSIIGESLSQIESSFKAKSLDWPSLDQPHAPGPEEAAASAPESVEATNKIVAAAEQLTATVRGAQFTLYDASMGYHLPACLSFAEKTHIVEILREAGSQGLHVKDIAKKSDQNELKLGHILRLLATHHIFREVKPNIFTNNRVSSFVDSGKSSAAILDDSDAKYNGTNGMAALIATAGDEMFKASAYMTENFMDPKTKHSVDPAQTSFQRSMNTNKLFFPWLEETGRVKRFGIAMVGTSQWKAGDAILQGFPWESLPKESLIVDVGGGVGLLSLKIAQSHPHFRMIIQDRPMVMSLGEELWKAELPAAVASGRVQFQAHDFFEPQPCEDASVFLLRSICHDWPDAYVVNILKHLRAAAQPHTKLILGDHIIPHACPDDTDASDLPGAAKTLAPPPLLANLGRANAIAYWADMTMQTLFHAQERTLSQFVDVFTQSGWKVTNVHRVGHSTFGHITAEPI